MATSHATSFQRVYVWERPVRLFHWVNATAIVVLGATGFLIGSPLTIASSDEAYRQYWFGTTRFIHFAAGYVLLFNFVIRLYWGFVGNRFSRWSTFFPVTRAHWREIIEVLKVDILQTHPTRIISLGHNSVAATAYMLSFGALLFQVATGFALYASMSGSPIPQLFAWVVPLMGSDAVVRYWHHVVMWFFVLFTLVHVYLVFYHDTVEGRGVASSIVGGWKFAHKGAIRGWKRKKD
jgi:Ni/Fe-hydrogenase 1 B-type cytochrome subunit